MAPPKVSTAPSAPIRINLGFAAKKGAASATLATPIGVIRRREGLSLPADSEPSSPLSVTRVRTKELTLERSSDRDRMAREELNAVGRLTSLTRILEALSAPASYRAYSAGVAMVAREIRKLSGTYEDLIPQRFGAATAEELAATLVTLFRKKGLLEKSEEFLSQRKSDPKKEPKGRVWTYGGAFLEELIKLDEALTAFVRSRALVEHRVLVAARSAIALSRGRGRNIQTPKVFSAAAQFSPVIRSTEVATQRRGNEKLFDSIDDVHCTIVKDGSRKNLVVLTRAQLKRKRAAEKLGKQTDNDIDRLISDDLEALVLKDHLDENNEPLRFSRDEILFVESAYTSPLGLVQSPASVDMPRIALDTFQTPKGITVQRLTLDVDTKLHDTLIRLIFTAERFRSPTSIK